MARRDEAVRARQLIAVLGRLKNGDRMQLSELASELGVTEQELTADLTMLSMCGVAPYDPYAMVPVMIEGSEVVVWGEVPALEGPVRLSRSEASALVAALQAAGFSFDDPVVERLVRASTSSFDPRELARVLYSEAGSHDVAVYETLAACAADGAVARITHASADAPEATERIIEPVSLFAERGVWYVTAWCHKADGWRTFRLDRILTAEKTAEAFAPRDDTPPRKALDATGLPTATLRFSAACPFSEREWPDGRLVEQHADGSATVEVPLTSGGWLARRVIARFGDVEVVSPAELRAAVAARARELAAG